IPTGLIPARRSARTPIFFPNGSDRCSRVGRLNWATAVFSAAPTAFNPAAVRSHPANVPARLVEVVRGEPARADREQPVGGRLVAAHRADGQSRDGRRRPPAVRPGDARGRVEVRHLDRPEPEPHPVGVTDARIHSTELANPPPSNGHYSDSAILPRYTDRGN